MIDNKSLLSADDKFAKILKTYTVTSFRILKASQFSLWLQAKNAIYTYFAVINANDFYGRDAFEKVY